MTPREYYQAQVYVSAPTVSLVYLKRLKVKSTTPCGIKIWNNIPWVWRSQVLYRDTVCVTKGLTLSTASLVICIVAGNSCQPFHSHTGFLCLIVVFCRVTGWIYVNIIWHETWKIDTGPRLLFSEILCSPDLLSHSLSPLGLVHEVNTYKKRQDFSYKIF